MKKTIAAEIEEMVAAGAQKVVDNKFTDANGNALKVRNMDLSNDPLEIGDEITIPADYQVIKVDINGNMYPCLIAEVKSADGGERNMRFFPNSLAKTVYPLTAEGTRGPKVKTTGDVARWYAGFESVDEALKEIAGKKVIKVTGKTGYKYRDYTTKEERSTNVYEYSWK